MFGYATNETEVLMPAPIYYAHELVKRQALVRRTTEDGRRHLRPDARARSHSVTKTAKRSASTQWCSPPSTALIPRKKNCVNW